MIEGKSRNREDVIDRLIDDILASRLSIVPLVRYKCTNTTELDKTGLTESSCTHSSRLPAQQTLIDIFTTTCSKNTGLRFAAIHINKAVCTGLNNAPILTDTTFSCHVHRAVTSIVKCAGTSDTKIARTWIRIHGIGTTLHRRKAVILGGSWSSSRVAAFLLGNACLLGIACLLGSAGFAGPLNNLDDKEVEDEGNSPAGRFHGGRVCVVDSTARSAAQSQVWFLLFSTRVVEAGGNFTIVEEIEIMCMLAFF